MRGNTYVRTEPGEGSGAGYGEAPGFVAVDPERAQAELGVHHLGSGLEDAGEDAADQRERGTDHEVDRDVDVRAVEAALGNAAFDDLAGERVERLREELV